MSGCKSRAVFFYYASFIFAVNVLVGIDAPARDWRAVYPAFLMFIVGWVNERRWRAGQ